MSALPRLQKGDVVEIIAPAARCSDEHLKGIKQLVESWGLQCIVNEALFGDDLLCANTDDMRFMLLKQALHNPHTKALIAARGGYGSMRLIPALSQLKKPEQPKLFLGMSDITALNLFFENKWRWPVLHGALAYDKFSPESIQAVKSILFGETTQIELQGVPLNRAAEENQTIDAVMTGGNLCIVQSSIGTMWQIETKNKILFLEEVSERGYRIDRMLEHLKQTNLLNHAAAILLGDFIAGQEPDGSSLIEPVLKRFAEKCPIPVISVAGIGHGYTNFPIPLGVKASLQLGNLIVTIPRLPPA